MNMRKLLLLAMVSAVFTGLAESKTVYVDCGVAASGDGTEWSKAYKTIQEAIDAATTVSGDTILVAPGEYAEGGRITDGGTDYPANNRVYIDKKLTLKANDSDNTKTIIRGRHHSADTAVGLDAVRCIMIMDDSSTSGTVIEGFTIADGAAQKEVIKDDTANTAAAAAGVSANREGYGHVAIVNCVITNCVGGRGGAVRNAALVRCVVTGCEGVNLSQTVGRKCIYFHCLLSRNYGVSSLTTEDTLVNSAIVENSGVESITLIGSSTKCLNSIIGMNKYATKVSNLDDASANSIFTLVSGSRTDLQDCRFGETYPFVSPISGDYRVRTGMEAATLGTVANLKSAVDSLNAITYNSDVDFYTSLDGVTINPESTAAIAVGPYQNTVATASGRLEFVFDIAKGGNYTIGGYTALVKGAYSYAASYPAVIEATLNGTDANAVFGLERHGETRSQYLYEFPDLNNKVCLGYPPVNNALAYRLILADVEHYVNGENGIDDETEGRGSSATNSYKTIQYAVDKGGSATNVIHVAAGTYKDCHSCGGTDSYTNGNACVVLKNVVTRIIGAGRDTTTIEGAKDEINGTEANYYCGTNAVRCVYAYKGLACIQGFKLEKGRAVFGTAIKVGSTGSTDLTPHRGGGVGVFESAIVTVADSKFTDCNAYRGGFAHGEQSTLMLQRCELSDGVAPPGGLIRGVYLRSSILTRITGSTVIDGTVCYLHHSTVHPMGGSVCVGGWVQHMDDCIIVGCNSLTFTATASVFRGTLMENVSCSLAGDFVIGKARFVEYGDATTVAPNFRLLANSDAFSCGMVFAEWHRISAGDFYNNPIMIVNGKPVAGAISTVPLTRYVVGAAPTGYKTTPTAGTYDLEPGESMTVKVEPTGENVIPTKGVVVGGVTNYTSSANPYAETSIAGTTTFPWGETENTVEILGRITDFYVNPNTDSDKGVVGSDANTGYWPDKPKQTLEAASHILSSYADGDILHLAEGEYTDGKHEDSTRGNSRFEIPQYLTVVGDGDVEKTLIYGEKTTIASPKWHGCGDGAMRCVYMNKGTELHNVTLTSGHTTGAESAAEAINEGGGYYALGDNGATGSERSILYNCVITNCFAGRGGAGQNGIMVGCKLLYNVGHACTSTGHASAMIGCFIDGCGQSQWCRNSSRVSHCTFGPHYSQNVTPGDLFDGTPSIDNCVILTSFTRNSGSPASKFYRCVIYCPESSTVWSDADKATAVDNGCVFVKTIDEFNLDEKYRPTKSATSVIDQAVTRSDLAIRDALMKVDAEGGQRIYNGTRDIGAFEYDWRGDYKTTVAGSDASWLSVAAASPDTVQADDSETGYTTLTLKNGKMVFQLTQASSVKFAFTIQGEGTMKVSVGDTVIGEFQKTGETPTEQTVSIPYQAANTKITFDYPYAATDAGVLLASAALKPGMVIIVR